MSGTNVGTNIFVKYTSSLVATLVLTVQTLVPYVPRVIGRTLVIFPSGPTSRRAQGLAVAPCPSLAMAQLPRCLSRRTCRLRLEGGDGGGGGSVRESARNLHERRVSERDAAEALG